MIKRKLILTGARDGFTGLLSKQWWAENGVITLVGDQQTVDGLTRYLGRRYQAYPEGELDGTGEIHARPQPRTPDPDAAGLPAQQSGPAPLSADHSGRADAPPAATPGRVPGGNGHADTGSRAQKQREEIRQAVTRLDPLNDEHWTQDGLPRVDVVAEAVGRADLTRRDLNKAASDMTRPAGG
jgi:hypothetical protein